MDARWSSAKLRILAANVEAMLARRTSGDDRYKIADDNYIMLALRWVAKRKEDLSGFGAHEYDQHAGDGVFAEDARPHRGA